MSTKITAQDKYKRLEKVTTERFSPKEDFTLEDLRQIKDLIK